MSRVIIDCDDEIDLEDGIRRVLRVVAEGRVSEAGGVKHFCWVTTWTDGVCVFVRRKRSKSAADSFRVSKRNEKL